VSRDTTRGHLEVPGGRLYYEVTGSGYPLTLLHAGIADLRMWDGQVEAFAERYRVIRYDLRGYGRTTMTDAPFSNRQDLRDLLDHLGAERTHLLGLSKGGQIALDVTLETPERVSALVAVACGPGGFEPTAEEEATPAFVELRATFDEVEAIEEARDWEALVERELEMWVDGPGLPPDRVDPAIREQMREVGKRNYANYVTDGRPQPLRPPAVGRLGEVEVPTLVIVGDLDTVFVQAAAQALAQGIPGARKLVVPGVAHMVNLEKPAEFERAVLDFLAKVDAGMHAAAR
jgi:pimeloyl-ACP methyl ester carboxylesterase